MIYANLEQLIADYLPEAKSPAEQATIGRIVESASAFVDRYCKRVPGYFERSGDVQTVKRVRGEGLHFLRLPVHLFGSISEINGQPFASFENFLYESEKTGWLYFESPEFGNDFSFGFFAADNAFAGTGEDLGFDYNCRKFIGNRIYKIKARWGYPTIPQPIVEAVRLLTVSIYETAKGTLGQISVEGFALKPNLIPPDVLLILERYKRREFEI